MSDVVVEVLNEKPIVGEDAFYEFSEESTSLGVPVIVKVVPAEGKSWVGQFYARNPYPKAVSTAITLNSSRSLIVISHGTGYIVDAISPTGYDTVPIYPVMHVLYAERYGVLLLCSFTDCVAYGETGLLWERSRIVDDEIVLKAGQDDTVDVEGWDFASDTRVNKVLGIFDGEVRRVQ